MARKCHITKKKGLSGNKRSHSLQTSKRRWNVNLQKATIIVNGKPKKIRISTSALKSLKKADIN